MRQINPNVHHFGVDDNLRPLMSSFVTAKGSPLSEVFWRPIRSLGESGLLEKIKRDAINGKQGRLKNNLGENPITITFLNIGNLAKPARVNMWCSMLTYIPTSPCGDP